MGIRHKLVGLRRGERGGGRHDRGRSGASRRQRVRLHRLRDGGDLERHVCQNGTWCGGVTGSGTYVQRINGNFFNHITGLNSVCNFAMKADFYDANGNWYAWRQTGTSYRCSSASDLPSIYINANVKQGYVRITLLSNGGTVSAARENIM